MVRLSPVWLLFLPGAVHVAGCVDAPPYPAWLEAQDADADASVTDVASQVDEHDAPETDGSGADGVPWVDDVPAADGIDDAWDADTLEAAALDTADIAPSEAGDLSRGVELPPDAGVDADLGPVPPECQRMEDGSPCDDGDPCTTEDRCHLGECLGVAVVADITSSDPADDGFLSVVPLADGGYAGLGFRVDAVSSAWVQRRDVAHEITGEDQRSFGSDSGRWAAGTLGPDGALWVVGHSARLGGTGWARRVDLEGDGDLDVLLHEASTSWFMDVTVTSGGELVAVGSSRAPGGIVWDVRVVRWSTAGEVAWSVAVERASDERGYSLVPTGDDGVLVVGTTTGGNGARDLLAVPLDAEGGAGPVVTVGSAADERPRQVRLSGDGGIVGVGTRSETLDGPGDVWLFELDADGELLWERSYGDPSADQQGVALAPCPGGDFLAVDTQALRRFDDQGRLRWRRLHGIAAIGGLAAAGLGEVPLLVGASAGPTTVADARIVRRDRWGNAICESDLPCALLASAGCDDDDACTADPCAPLSGCTHEPVDLACDDGDACTVDGCDSATEACSNLEEPGAPGCCADAAACDDGQPCTTDTCSSAGCVHVEQTWAVSQVSNGSVDGAPDAHRWFVDAANGPDVVVAAGLTKSTSNCDGGPNPCTDLVVTAFEGSGDVRWHVWLGTPTFQKPRDITRVGDALLVVGAHKANDEDPGAGWAARFDAHGGLTWSAVHPGVTAWSAAVEAGDDVAVVVGEWPGAANLSASFGIVGADGELLAPASQLGGPESADVRLWSLAPAADAGGGWAAGGQLGAEAWFVRISASGEAVSTVVVEGIAGNDGLRSVQPRAEGGWMAVGTHCAGSPVCAGAIVRLSDEGACESRFTLEGQKSRYLTAIAAVADGGYVAVGNAEHEPGVGGQAWVVRVSAAGEPLYDRVVAPAQHTSAFRGVVPFATPGFIAVGEGLEAKGAYSHAWAVGLDAWAHSGCDPTSACLDELPSTCSAGEGFSSDCVPATGCTSEPLADDQACQP